MSRNSSELTDNYLVNLAPLFTGDGLAVRGMSLLRRVNHRDPLIQKYAYKEFVHALQEPLREGLFANCIITDIFPSVRIE